MRYPARVPQLLSPADPFTSSEGPLDVTVLDFWRWALSDLVSNTTRGWLAEFIVAKALGIAHGVRTPWDSYDLRLPSGLTIEVKASGFLQAWGGKQLSKPVFSIRPARAWDAETNTYADEVRRQADVYVFCLLAHRDPETLNPLCVDQWEFYVVPTAVLNERCGTAKALSLRVVQTMTTACGFAALPGAITGTTEHVA
jgi:hypothetical protein